MCFTCNKSSNSHSNPTKYILFLSSIHKWGNYIIEKLSKLPEIHCYRINRAGIQTLPIWLHSLNHYSYTTSYILIYPFPVYVSYNNFTIFLRFPYEMENFIYTQKETEWYKKLLCTHHPVSTVINSAHLMYSPPTSSLPYYYETNSIYISSIKHFSMYLFNITTPPLLYLKNNDSLVIFLSKFVWKRKKPFLASTVTSTATFLQ